MWGTGEVLKCFTWLRATTLYRITKFHFLPFQTDELVWKRWSFIGLPPIFWEYLTHCYFKEWLSNRGGRYTKASGLNTEEYPRLLCAESFLHFMFVVCKCNLHIETAKRYKLRKGRGGQSEAKWVQKAAFKLLTCPFLAIAVTKVLHRGSLGRAQTFYYPSFCGFLPLIPQSHTPVLPNLETLLTRDPSDTASFIPALHSLSSTRKASDGAASLFTQHMRIWVPEGS